jgi:predicted NBD/HSP70 family sugar kinase
MRPPSALEEIRDFARQIVGPAAARHGNDANAGADPVTLIRSRAAHDGAACIQRLVGEGTGEALVWVREEDDGGISLAVLRQGRPIAAVIHRTDGYKPHLLEAYADIDGVLVDGKKLVRRKGKSNSAAEVDPDIAELFPCWRDLMVGHLDKTIEMESAIVALCEVATGRNTGFAAVGIAPAATVIAGAFIAMKAGRRCTDLFGRRLFPVIGRAGRAPLVMPPILAGEPIEVRRAARLNQARFLPTIEITGYNAERIGAGEDGFLGDNASDRAFLEIIEKRRKHVSKRGDDPLGDLATDKIKDSDLDRELEAGAPRSRDFVRAATDSFGARVAGVIRAFLGWEYWRGTERIVIGGGLASHKVGRHVIAVARKELQRDFPGLRLRGISHDSDDAALIGAVHLFHPESLEKFDAILTVDIGGTKIRAGAVKMRLGRHPDLSAAEVWKKQIWRHGGSSRSRDRFVERLAEMLNELIARAARHDVRLAPFIGIACPGIVDRGSYIWRGTQNLPGDWSAPFNLARAIEAALPEIDGRRTRVRIHNDAVVQGLGELPFMRGVARWGIFTIGTGLGNAHFTAMRHPAERSA